MTLSTTTDTMTIDQLIASERAERPEIDGAAIDADTDIHPAEGEIDSNIKAQSKRMAQEFSDYVMLGVKRETKVYTDAADLARRCAQ